MSNWRPVCVSCAARNRNSNKSDFFLIIKSSKFLKINESAVKTSFELSYLIAKNSRPFIEGDFIKTCLLKAAENMCPEKIRSFQNISLSRNTVAERISEIANDLRGQLQEGGSNFQSFSIAIDESTDVGDIAQIALFVRACDENMKITEELVEIIPISGTTTGEDIFVSVWTVLEKYKFPMDKLVSVTTDGAPAMTGKVKGFVSRLESKLLEMYPKKLKLIAFHCIIHQQVLCSKILDKSNVLQTVTKIVNFIRSKGLNHRQFTAFLKDLECEYGEIPYYTEVRWLSCHKVLKAFFLLVDEIVMFLEMKGQDATLLKDLSWLQNLAFLVDITSHLNALNIKLQGKGKLITDMCDAISSFICKLALLQNHLKQNNLTHFRMCETLRNQNKYCFFSQYAQNLENVKIEFDNRFKDFNEQHETFLLFTGPFSYNVEKAPASLQMELIDFQNDSILKEKYQEIGVPKIYSFLNKKYPLIKAFAAQILSYFGSTYLCEQLFSHMNINKTVYRSRLTNEHFSAIMKIACSQDYLPNLEKLVDSKRCQVSGKRT